MKIEAHGWKIEVKEGYVNIEKNGVVTKIESTDFHCFKISESVEPKQTEYIPTTTPVHADRYGKELKVGDRIYLEKWQEAVDLTNGGDWSSEYVDINDCFTILGIGDKEIVCDWNVDGEVSKILTSELNKFTKI